MLESLLRAYHQLKPDGFGLGSNAHLLEKGGELPRLVDIASQEAIPKVCDVGMAMLQGHNWTPNLSNGSRVNVGTISVAPQHLTGLLDAGKVRCRLIPPEWDGGPVVVRGRESRSHGEGVQRVRRIIATCGGHW